ncbi:hypothetical protein [Burkholderia sp. F1]|uniref:hypothetical protein n=1 Tax=Burkholderia sp. F1 TaxID=3366817 RepID=UPI003D71E735
MKRPISLTILAWVIIVTSAFTLINTPFSLRNPMVIALYQQCLLPIWATIGFGVVSAALNVAIGIAILRARGWARTAYIAVSAVGIVVSLINFPYRMVLIPGVLLCALFVYLLYRRPATAYFSQARG